MRGRDLHVSVPHPLHPSRAARCWPGPIGSWPLGSTHSPFSHLRPTGSTPPQATVLPWGKPGPTSRKHPQTRWPRTQLTPGDCLSGAGPGPGVWPGRSDGLRLPRGREGGRGRGRDPSWPGDPLSLSRRRPPVTLPSSRSASRKPLSLLDPRPLAGLAPFAPSRLVPRQGAGGRIQPSWPRRGPGHWCHIPEGQWQNQKQPCGPRLQRASWGRHPSVTGQWPMGTGQRGDKARNQACVLVWLWRHGWTGQSSCLLERGCLGGRGSGIGWKTLVGCGRWRNRQAGWITGGRRGFLWTRLPPWVYI